MADAAPRGRTRAVVDGELLHWSPSQIKKFECQRRWYMDKVCGVSEPSSEAMDRGSAIHKEIENRLLRGEPTGEPLAALAYEWVQAQPWSGEVFVVESALDDPPLLLGGVPVTGYIDLLVPPATPGGLVHIIDWKTRSDFRYAPKDVRTSERDEMLEDDLQMLTYAAWARRKFPEALQFRLTHVNLRTRGKPAIKPVSVVVDVDHVERFERGLGKKIERMAGTARCASLEDVPANWSRCFDFNRPCPYLAHCLVASGPDFPQSHLTPELEEMSLSEKLAARKAIRPKSGGINPPDAAASPAPTKQPSAQAAPVTAPADNLSGTTPAKAQGVANTMPAGVNVIFLDCEPSQEMVKLLGMPVVRLADEIAARARPIAEAAGVSDVREIKYAEGTSRLIGAFNREPLKGRIIVASSGGLSTMIIEVLAPGAAMVRGMR